MFGFKKSASDQASENTPSLLERLKSRLGKTRSNLTEGLADLVLGKKLIDSTLLEEVESLLLSSDVGIDATEAIINDLTARIQRKQLDDSDALMAALHENMTAILTPCDQPLQIPDTVRPFVILMVGVNGVGKTTTIGKLSKHLQQNGLSVMLAAGDTFRAAAVEQLQQWGERNDVPVVAQHTGADSASVIYDAFQSAQARGIDVLIADTAGRLHTQTNLMEELKKINRVIGKLDDTAPHETLLVVDAATGQNALTQATQFHAAVGLSGIVISKLDGSARGGIVFALANKLGLPIRFIGVGEAIDDLREFEAEAYVAAMLEK